MSGLDVFVVDADWAEKLAILRELRHQVFVLEQGVDADEEFDGQDPHSQHFLAINEAGQALGCARLRTTSKDAAGTPTDAKVERMAVLAQHRSTGIGAKLLDAVIERAKQMGLPGVYLHAQAHAEGFYRAAGFLPEGPRFLEANIEHQKMRLALPLPFEPADVEESTAPKARAHRLGATPDVAPPDSLGNLAFDDENSAFAGLLRALESPRRHLCIYSPELDPALFDQRPLVDALSKFVRSSPGNELRVLIHSSRRIVSRGHRLIELARRLDSKIRIRKTLDDTLGDERSFVCWDTSGYWLLPNHEEYTGFADGNDGVMATRLQEQFDLLWARATEDPELRVLGL